MLYKQINAAGQEGREVEVTGAITKEWRNQTPASVGANTRVQWRHTYGDRLWAILKPGHALTKRTLLRKRPKNNLY